MAAGTYLPLTPSSVSGQGNEFDAPEQMQMLLRAALAVAEVLAGGSPPPQNGGAAPALDQLSDAELRVLRYLPSNLAAPEIANELYVSVNTVKTHMRHIYAKLDAHRRTEAVNRARELGLLALSAQ